MHYYQKNIADYRKDTGHLSLLEHGIYNQIIDTYYLDEKPIETQLVMRRLSIKTEEEKVAFQNVLNDFFKRSECGNFWAHKRIDEEITTYHARAEAAKANGRKGGRPKKPKKTQPVNPANPKETESKPNQEPLTINQEPLTINQEPDVKVIQQKDFRIMSSAGELEDYADGEQLVLIATDKFDDDGEVFQVLDAEIQKLKKLFYSLDVEEELIRFVEFAKVNTRSRVSADDTFQFLYNSLAKKHDQKVQNRGSTYAANRPNGNPRPSLQQKTMEQADAMDAYIASVEAGEQAVGKNESDVRLQVVSE